MRGSHILPEFLYEALYDEKHRFLAMFPDDLDREETLQKGLREPGGLLCADCEQDLGKNERYASQLMFHQSGHAFVHGGIVFVPGVDYVKFRLFLLSLLWRMGESSLDAFENVRLGPHAERLRTMLLARNPGKPHEYPCVLMAIRHRREIFRRTLVPPIRIKESGYTCYALTAAGFLWGFWVGSHMSARTVGRSVLMDDGILPVHTMKAEQVERFMRSLAQPQAP